MLRGIKFKDAEELQKINASQLGYDVPLDITRKQIKKLLLDNENHFLLVFEDEITHEVLGYVHAELYQTIYSDSMFNILALAVAEKAEKRGIGKLLMQGVEQEAKRRRIPAIRLNSGESRIEAHKFYEHIGYSSDKWQKRFLKILE